MPSPDRPDDADAEADDPRLLRTPWLVGFVVAAVVVTAVATWLVVGVAHAGRAQARAGATYATGRKATTQAIADVALPWGMLEVGATAPRTRLPKDVGEFTVGASPLPPEGGRFVGVHWSQQPSSSGGDGIVAHGDVNTHVSVRTQGHSYPLERASIADRYCPSGCIGRYADNTVWVAVRGDAAQLRIAVDYDGVTQTVDPRTGRIVAGRAAALYRSRGARTAACGVLLWSASFSADPRDSSCAVMTKRTAWAPTVGWARAGTEWTLVSVTIIGPGSVHRQGRREDDLVLDALTTYSYSLGGARPAGQGLTVSGDRRDRLGPQPRSSGTSTVLAFATTVATAGAQSSGSLTLTIRGQYELEPGDVVRQPSTGTAVATWAVQL